jgi:hypothetical protein
VEPIPAPAPNAGTPELRLVESRPLGGAFLLHRLWKKLGIDRALAGVARSSSQKVDPVPAMFAMVANRALAPSSKHAIPAWAARDVVLPGVDALTDDQLYRAMDFLIEAEAKVQEAVFFAAADLLNLQVDLLLYDTTSSYLRSKTTMWRGPTASGPGRRSTTARARSPSRPARRW